MAGASADAHTPYLVSYIVGGAGTAVDLPGQVLRLLTKDGISAAKAFGQCRRCPVLFIRYLFQQGAGCLDITPFQVNTAEVAFGDNTVLVEVHSPGHDTTQLDRKS